MVTRFWDTIERLQNAQKFVVAQSENPTKVSIWVHEKLRDSREFDTTVHTPARCRGAQVWRLDSSSVCRLPKRV